MRASKEPRPSLCRWLLLAGISFGVLTRADGAKVYLVPDMITEVTPPYAGACPHNAKAFVRTLSSTYCVLESPEDAVRILKEQPTTREPK